MARPEPKYLREGPMAYQDYASLPDDGYQYELVNRRLEVMSPSPSTIHQMCVMALAEQMNSTCEQDYLVLVSPIDVVFSERDTRQPDLVVVKRDRMNIVKMRGVFGVPDLVVEVLSEWSVQRDRLDKLQTYSQYGLHEYWIVDPLHGSLEQYLRTNNTLALAATLQGSQYVNSPQLTCMAFTMEGVMARIPPISE